jgi:trans-aconitate methyltransferase
MEALFIVVLILLTLVLLGMALALMLGLIGFMTTRAPFVPVSRAIARKLPEVVRLHSGSVFYDLGSGDGRIVRAMARAYPDATCVGIEKAPLPFLVSSFLTGKNAPNASIRFGNIFSTPLSDATHVFCYLLPPVMRDLYPTFIKELKPGTKVISCDFPLTEKEPWDIVHADGYKLYVYEF